MAYVLHRRAQRMAWSGSCNEGSREDCDKNGASEDRKRIKKLERRRQKAMVEGDRNLAAECHAAIQSLQGRQ